MISERVAIVCRLCAMLRDNVIDGHVDQLASVTDLVARSLNLQRHNNMQESFNRSHSSLRSAIERSFGILKKRWKILGKMPKYSVKNQLDIITAAFTLHNYIRNNDKEDTVFTTFEQHPDYMGGDELHDVRGLGANHDDISSGTSNEMKQIRNDIATSIWNARCR
ncbi:putative nuclease HARBI1 [Tanacetum coccineum]|uniref:Nuclease HARBI1 n=1 Tax=Tanacetum coccineum TaxID=301880 RepID=A0ABQ5EPI0_9ASTR